MKSSGIGIFIKRIIDFLPKENIEKIIFKLLFVVWVIVTAGVVMVRSALETRHDIEKEIMKAGVNKNRSTKFNSYIDNYEALLTKIKYPEGIEEYRQYLRRDPFSEFSQILIAEPGITEHDFVLKSVDRVPLPMVYKGYIELPDRIIGQINWRDSTRFVQVNTTLNGYSISGISKEKIDAIDENGKKIVFELDKPVLGEELEAVLYDNISGKTFNAQKSGEIDNYKVVDITPDYVILVSGDVEIKLVK